MWEARKWLATQPSCMIWTWVLVQVLSHNEASTVLCLLAAWEPNLLCTCSALQYSFKLGKRNPLRAAEMPMGRRQKKEFDKICVQQGYIRASHWRTLLLNKGWTPRISVFHFSFVLRVDFGQQEIKSEKEGVKFILNGMQWHRFFQVRCESF